ncbi:MAG: deoxyribonuclease V [Candidatus Competibacteraceae bacterium]|jgi:deoxyribonuclease V|nr:deoxyribonuclease V [Candidatus Competibacteraceae bacterium]
MVVDRPSQYAVELEQLTPTEAIALQNQLRDQVIVADHFDQINRVAGLDVGFIDQGKITRAAVAVLSYPELELMDTTLAYRPTCFPYIPGLLSFRELPALLDAMAQLNCIPDLLLCDGQGIAHPRRLGIASHLGLVTDIPAIGVAKTRLCGTHGPVPEQRGQWATLQDDQELIGAVLRTRSGVKPLYISPGHRISVTTAVEYVLGCCTRFRLPETTRHAHRLASTSY